MRHLSRAARARNVSHPGQFRSVSDTRLSKLIIFASDAVTGTWERTSVRMSGKTRADNRWSGPRSPWTRKFCANWPGWRQTERQGGEGLGPSKSDSEVGGRRISLRCTFCGDMECMSSLSSDSRIGSGTVCAEQSQWRREYLVGCKFLPPEMLQLVGLQTA
ncbi:hypothetical protein VFPBJ_11210 [Purpureocillium lilacinum]|uniref:Uncharacterized protein n=1 Tax=Purpureocillium lilacinum TaxID=33203 RepID=A0A179FK42_PURLI|nr:hypothetical protein VFPBJ_11210 [Purpureocillium lilacinum]